MAAGPVQCGGKMPKPAKGMNGPNGSGGGTKHYAPPMPSKTRNGVQAGTKKK